MKKLYTIVGLVCLAHSLLAQFQWEHTGGPEGLGDFETYYNKDYAFLYDNFQFYRTGDGQTWDVIQTIHSGIIDVTDTRISIYQEVNMGPDDPKEIQFLLSADNGDSWHPAPVPQDAYFNNNQIMLCSHGIYFKAGERLYRSQTEGQSWKQVSYDSISFILIFSSNDKIFGRSEEKIFEYNPQSGKWTHSWIVPPSGYLGAVHINGSNIIVLAGNLYYASQNKGETWKTFGANSDLNTHLVEKDNIVYFQSGQTIRYTQNGGQNWKSILLDGSYHKYSLFQNKFLLFSQETGCYLFDEVNNIYLPANEGLFSSSVKYLRADNDHLWVETNDKVLNKLDIKTGIWTYDVLPKPNSNSFSYSINPSGKLLYENFTFGKILLSTDKGTTWDTLSLDIRYPFTLRRIFWIGDLIYAESYGVQLISQDFGVKWDTIPTRLYNPILFQNQIWDIVSPGKLIVSSDNGLSWNDVNTNLKNISWIVAAEDRIFAWTTSEAFRMYSSVDGINWQFSGDGLSSNLNPEGIIFDGNVWKHEGMYFSYNWRTGFNYSLDNCSSWEQIIISNSYLTTFTSLKDSVYFGNNSGGGVLVSPIPRFDRPLARGFIFNDLNEDGIKDNTEDNIPDVQVMLNASTHPRKNYFTLSNQEGKFEIRPSIGSYDTIRPNILSEYITSIEPPYYIIQDSVENYEFAVHFRPNLTDGTINGKFNILPFSGDHLNALVTYYNNGTVPMSGDLGVKLDPGFLFIKASPSPTNIINSDSLVWHFEDMPIFSRNEILIEGRLSPAVPEGTSVGLYGTLLPNGIDVNLSDNQFDIEDSFDFSPVPNSKSVIPEEGMTVAEMLEGKELEYTIRFQNQLDYVVNTVQISDVLPQNLDYKTIRIVGSSHEIAKWELLPTGVLRIFFDNMNLAPINSNYKQSLGFLSFAIKMRKDNAEAFNFTNTANIIFDNVKTIATNAVRTRWLPAVVSATEDIITESIHKLSIIPNPASQNCYLSTNGRIKGKGIIRIFNTSGRSLSVQQVQDLSMNIELQTDQLMNGFYLITVEGAEGIMHGKLIIQK